MNESQIFVLFCVILYVVLIYYMLWVQANISYNIVTSFLTLVFYRWLILIVYQNYMYQWQRLTTQATRTHAHVSACACVRAHTCPKHITLRTVNEAAQDICQERLYSILFKCAIFPLQTTKNRGSSSHHKLQTKTYQQFNNSLTSVYPFLLCSQGHN